MTVRKRRRQSLFSYRRTKSFDVVQVLFSCDELEALVDLSDYDASAFLLVLGLEFLEAVIYFLFICIEYIGHILDAQGLAPYEHHGFDCRFHRFIACH